VNARRNESRLAPRALRIRNRCLAILAARRALPIPTDAETAELGDEIGLDQAFGVWYRRHTPPTAASAVTTPWRRSNRYARVGVGVGVLAIVVVLLVRGLTATRAGAQPVPVRWLTVDDSVAAGVQTKLRRLAHTKPPTVVSLSAADVAALLFDAPPPYRTQPLDSLEARLDSALWLRGRVHGAFRFELGGRLRLVRRRIVAVRVTRLMVDGIGLPASAMPPYLQSIAPQAGVDSAGELLFGLRSPVAEMRFVVDSVVVVAGRP
jgi:hypothetical protein